MKMPGRLKSPPVSPSQPGVNKGPNLENPVLAVRQSHKGSGESLLGVGGRDTRSIPPPGKVAPSFEMRAMGSLVPQLQEYLCLPLQAPQMSKAQPLCLSVLRASVLSQEEEGLGTWLFLASSLGCPKGPLVPCSSTQRPLGSSPSYQ